MGCDHRPTIVIGVRADRALCNLEKHRISNCAGEFLIDPCRINRFLESPANVELIDTGFSCFGQSQHTVDPPDTHPKYAKYTTLNLAYILSCA